MQALLKELEFVYDSFAAKYMYVKLETGVASFEFLLFCYINNCENIDVKTCAYFA